MFERFSATARQVVLRAVQEAERRKASSVTEEHMTLALLADPTTGAGRLLAEHEVRDADIETAFAEARRRGGLSESDASALRELGIDVSDVVEGVERAHGPGALSSRSRRRRRFRIASHHVRFSDEAKGLLERTLREALELRDRRLDDAHILLAVLTRGGVAAEVLARYGMTHTEVRAKLRARAGLM